MKPRRQAASRGCGLGLLTLAVLTAISGVMIWLADAGGGTVAALLVGLGVPALLGVAVVVGHWLTGQRTVQATGMSLRKLDHMTGRQFEAWIAGVLRRNGFRIHDTPHAGDFGVDVLCAPPAGGGRIAIQAKRYKGRVGNAAVQQAIAGAQYYDCQASAVVTQSRFTSAAKRQARRADPPVLLIDRSQLHRMPDLLASLTRAVNQSPDRL